MSDENWREKTDEELMLFYQEGEEQAIHELYRRYSTRIYSYLHRRISEKDWVDDVFQQVFSKLHQSRHQYDPAFRFDQWIFVMTKTVLLDYWKTTNLKTRRYFSGNLDESKLVSEESDSAHQLEIPQPAWASLSSEQQTVMNLRFFDELSYQEIATKLNRSEAGIRQLVSRAIKKLRNQIKSPGGKSEH